MANYCSGCLQVTPCYCAVGKERRDNYKIAELHAQLAEAEKLIQGVFDVGRIVATMPDAWVKQAQAWLGRDK